MLSSQVSWKILELQSQLVSDESDVSVEMLMESKLWFQPQHYADVIEERANIRKCGYPLCENSIQIPNTERVQYRIDYKNKQIFSIEESKFYCSTKCLEESLLFKASLDTSNPVTRPVAKSLLDENNVGGDDRVLGVFGSPDDKKNPPKPTASHIQTISSNNDESDVNEEESSALSGLPPPPSFANEVLSKYGKVQTNRVEQKKSAGTNRLFTSSAKTLTQPSLFRDNPRKPTQRVVPSQRRGNSSGIMKEKIEEKLDATVQSSINLLSSNESSEMSKTVRQEPAAVSSAAIPPPPSSSSETAEKHVSMRPVFHPSTTTTSKPSASAKLVASSPIPAVVVNSHEFNAVDEIQPFREDYIQKPSKSILDLLASQRSMQGEAARSAKESSDDLQANWTEPVYESRPVVDKVYRGRDDPNEQELRSKFTDVEREQYPEWFAESNKSKESS
jgi:hypothetical protein